MYQNAKHFYIERKNNNKTINHQIKHKNNLSMIQKYRGSLTLPTSFQTTQKSA